MSKHVVVVGGGIIGLCCAYYLLRDGHRVTLVDRGEAATENCSHGNAGLVVPSHIVPMAAPGVMLAGLKWMRDPESPFFVKPRLAPDLAMWGWRFFRAGTAAHVERSAPLLRDLNMASRAAYEELSDELPDFDFQKRGLMMLFKTEAALEEESHVVEQAKKLGMPAEILDAKGASERDPAIRMDIQGAAYYPNDCHLSPSKLMVGLQRELEKGGATLRWNTEVCDWKIDGGQLRAAVLASATGEREELEAE
ncbi:MAG TPA: FAD-dependent oxidoreductase, partial [Abditibacterium sp.]